MHRDIKGLVEQISQFAAVGWAHSRSGRPLRICVELGGRRYEPDTRWDSRRKLSATDAPAVGKFRFTVAFAPELSARLADDRARNRLVFLANDVPLKRGRALKAPRPFSIRRLSNAVRNILVRSGKLRPPGAREQVRSHTDRVERLWAALRTFNQQLPEQAGSEHLLLDKIAGQLTGDLREELVLSLVPFFCRIGKFDAVGHHISEQCVETLAQGTNRFTLSLALPFLLARGDLPHVARTLSRLAEARTEWLNTECVAYAFRLALGERAIKPPQATEQLVAGLLSLLDSLRDDFWSRLPDSNLIEAFVTCLKRERTWSDQLGHALTASALGIYGMNPTFWKMLADRPAGDAAIRARLAIGHRQFQRIDDGISDRQLLAEEFDAICDAIDYFRQHGNIEADAVLREVIANQLPGLNGAGDRQAACMRAHRLLALGAEEAVRLAAFPVPGENRLMSGPGELRATLAGMGEEGLQGCTGAMLAPAMAAMEELRRHLRCGDDPGRDASLRRLCQAAIDPGDRYGDGLGFDLLARTYELLLGAGLDAKAVAPARASLIASARTALGALKKANWPPAPILAGLGKLKALPGLAHDPGVQSVVAECERRMHKRFRQRFEVIAQALAAAPAGRFAETSSDILVVVNSRRDHLDTHVPGLRTTWIAELERRGIPVLIAIEGERTGLKGDLLTLAAGDGLEEGTWKFLKLADWVLDHTGFQYVLTLDDDCYLDVASYFGSPSYRKHHYYGAVRGSAPFPDADAGAGPSIYAHGETGLCLSRLALACLVQTSRTARGEQIVAEGMPSDRLIGELLLRNGMLPASEDCLTLVRRRLFDTAIPVNVGANSFFPSALAPVKVAHLETADDIIVAHDRASRSELWPKKIWPCHVRPALGSNRNQLELLTAAEKAMTLLDQEMFVVSVVRDEMLMLPHFLDHYRRLGVRCFVFVDNLSDDGTREMLLSMPDVVLYSADTEYRQSHYGVAWQQAVLANHGLGKWVLLADADELLVYRNCETRALIDLVREVEQQGCDAVRLLMVDMYPGGELATADFTHGDPFAVASYFDYAPVTEWHLGGGAFGNDKTYLSTLRHRLIPAAAPNSFMAQKYGLFKYAPWVRLSDGIHYAANLRPSPDPAWFAHFKYHSRFQHKVEMETRRKQHFNGAAEYRDYERFLSETGLSLWSERVSTKYGRSHDFAAAKPSADSGHGRDNLA